VYISSRTHPCVRVILIIIVVLIIVRDDSMRSVMRVRTDERTSARAVRQPPSSLLTTISINQSVAIDASHADDDSIDDDYNDDETRRRSVSTR